jgi:putative ABC transport system permease protein
VEIAGKAVGEDLLTLVQRVSVGYFRVLRIEFTRGRPFSEAEIDRARHVAVVNETFVRRYLPGEDPIGRRLRLAGPGTAAGPGHDAWFDIVGVVADVFNSGGLQLPTNPEVWMPYTIAGSAPDALIVHTSQEPGTIANAVRQEVWRTDSGVALSGPGPLNDLISEQLYTAPRFGFAVMTSFGAVGLILVTVGVYSVLAYATTQKTHEIGVRMALGAERSAVLGMVVRAGLRLVMAGVVVGIGVSLVLARFLETQLAGMTAYDPTTLAATTALLMMTAAIACWIPARKAARVDPLIALRHQ